MSQDPIEVAIAVVERHGHFLVGLRPEGKPLAGFSEFPGGRVEAGETAADAAIRECLEETAVEVAVESEYDSVTHQYEHGIVCLRFFACRAASETVPSAPFRWVPRNELNELRFPAANAQLVADLSAAAS